MFRENKEFAARDVLFIICPSGGAKDGLSDLKNHPRGKRSLFAFTFIKESHSKTHRNHRPIRSKTVRCL